MQGHRARSTTGRHTQAHKAQTQQGKSTNTTESEAETKDRHAQRETERAAAAATDRSNRSHRNSAMRQLKRWTGSLKKGQKRKLPS